MRSSVRHPVLERRVFGLTLYELDCSLHRHRGRPPRLAVVDTRFLSIGAQSTLCVLHILRDDLVKHQGDTIETISDNLDKYHNDCLPLSVVVN